MTKVGADRSVQFDFIVKVVAVDYVVVVFPHFVYFTLSSCESDFRVIVDSCREKFAFWFQIRAGFSTLGRMLFFVCRFIIWFDQKTYLEIQKSRIN